jgi:hypothetical protein
VRTGKIWRLFQECARPDPKAPIQRLFQRNPPSADMPRQAPQPNNRRIDSYLIFARKKPLAGPAVNDGTYRENGGCRLL